MSIKLAQEFEFNIAKKITHETIKEIHPHYYSNGAVVFFSFLVVGMFCRFAENGFKFYLP